MEIRLNSTLKQNNQQGENLEMILCPGCFADYLLPAIVNQTKEIIRICNECNCIVYHKDGCIKTTNLTTFMEERGLPDCAERHPDVFAALGVGRMQSGIYIFLLPQGVLHRSAAYYNTSGSRSHKTAEAVGVPLLLYLSRT